MEPAEQVSAAARPAPTPEQQKAVIAELTDCFIDMLKSQLVADGYVSRELLEKSLAQQARKKRKTAKR